MPFGCTGLPAGRTAQGKYPLSLLAFPHSFPPFPFPRTHSYFHFRTPHGGGFPISTKSLIGKKKKKRRWRNKPSIPAQGKREGFAKRTKPSHLPPPSAGRVVVVIIIILFLIKSWVDWLGLFWFFGFFFRLFGIDC